MKEKKSILRVYTSCLMIFSFVVFTTSINARELDGVSMPDSVMLSGTDTPLVLNGMGYRTKFVFDIYVGALYTESKVSSQKAVHALTGPKRVAMHMVLDEVSHAKMADAWREGFEDNNSDVQLEKLKARLKVFVAYFPDLKKGNEVLLDYIPDVGTRVTISGEEKGVIEGADFNAALLDVWLGEEPADDDLKDAMLGLDDSE
jgi:hypothetical protein